MAVCDLWYTQGLYIPFLYRRLTSRGRLCLAPLMVRCVAYFSLPETTSILFQVAIVSLISAHCIRMYCQPLKHLFRRLASTLAYYPMSFPLGLDGTGDVDALKQ